MVEHRKEEGDTRMRRRRMDKLTNKEEEFALPMMMKVQLSLDYLLKKKKKRRDDCKRSTGVVSLLLHRRRPEDKVKKKFPENDCTSVV